MAKGWLDNYNDSKTSAPEGFQGEGYSNIGRNYSPAWGGSFQMGGYVYPVNYVPQAQMGGTIAGAPGFSYARTQGAAPSNGKYAKKTMASAQNGKEMQYYQNGLDWQPKTISKNGSWLSKYDVAQDGDILDKFREYHPSVRSIQNNAMNRKIQQNKGKGKETTVTQKDNTRTVTPKIGKIATVKEKEQRAIEQNKLAQKQSEQQATKDWVQGSMEEAYKSPLMSPGYFTPEGVAIGALQGAFKMPGHIAEGDTWGVVGDAAMMLPFAKPAATTLRRALGTESGLLSNAYKLNPYAERLNNPNKSYRVAGMDALEDFQNTGVLRSQRVLPENATFLDRVQARPTSFPSFQKGYADLNYLPEGGGTIFETNLPTFRRGDINPVTGTQIGGRHYAHRVINPETGAALSEIPASDIKVFGDKPHWLQGYAEIPKSVAPELRQGLRTAGPSFDDLPKELEPYISKKVFNDNPEQHIFESSFQPEQRNKLLEQRTKYYDSEGNEIPKPDRFLKQGGIIRDDRGQWAKNKKNLLSLQLNWLSKFE